EEDHTDPESVERGRCRVPLRSGHGQMMAKPEGSAQTWQYLSEQRQLPGREISAPLRSAEAEHPGRLALASDHSAGKVMNLLRSKPIVVVLGSKEDAIRAHFAAELDDPLAPALGAPVAEKRRHRGEVVVVGLHVARVLAHGELDVAPLAHRIAEEKRH